MTPGCEIELVPWRENVLEPLLTRAMQIDSEILQEEAMELKLSVEEHEFLFNVLEQRHQELLSEIAHTEDREFKKGLRRDEQLLESLVSRLRETATVQRVHV